MRSARLGPLLIVLTACAACGDGSRSDVPPLPDLTNREPRVVAKITRLHRALASDPTREAWLAYGRTLHAHQLLEPAEDAYLAAAACDERAAFEPLYLAGCAIAAAVPIRAVEHFRGAAALEPGRAHAWLRLAEALEQLGRRDEAEGAFRRASELEPSLHAWLGLARAALGRGDRETTCRLLERARAAAADAPEPHAMLARVYRLMGRDADAAVAADRAGDGSTTTPFADPLLRAVNEESESYLGWERRARAAFARGEFDAALRAITTALEVRPDSVAARFIRGSCFGNLGRFAEAVPDFESVLSRSPDWVDAHHLLASCLANLGRFEASRRHFERTVALAPDLDEARFKLAGVLARLGAFAEAESHVALLLGRHPDHVPARVLYAKLLESTRREDQAREEWAAVLRRDAGHAEARAALQRLGGG